MADTVARASAPDKFMGKRSGLLDLDKMLGGFCDGELTLVGAPPGMGKTSFALGVLMHVAKTAPCLFFSLEMPQPQVMARAHAIVSQVPINAQLRCEMDREQYSELMRSVEEVSALPIALDCTPGYTAQQIRHVARRHHQRVGKLGLIVIDFVQRVHWSKGFATDENQALSYISRSLTDLAKELECPVVALSQLNRAYAKRQDKRPELADLRGSGSLEADANNIIFLYRDEEYNDETPDYIWFATQKTPLPTGQFASVARRSYDQTTYGNINLVNILQLFKVFSFLL